MAKTLNAYHELVGTFSVNLGTSMFLVRRRAELLFNGHVSVENVQRALTTFDEIDDVYSPDFAAQGTLIFPHLTPNPPILDDSVNKYFESTFERKCIHQKTENKADWTGGPYFLQENQLHQAWRLYPDELEASVSTTIPAESDPYTVDPFKVTIEKQIFSGSQSLEPTPPALQNLGLICKEAFEVASQSYTLAFGTLGCPAGI
ncbi:hypothetical protein B0J14DRAFT_674368 [Halenospora varia]|nr:hypothetical protein B0J14DRAFT_674368 [Halenospora varia]